MDEDFVRHLVLNTYRMFRNQFSKEYGELVICDDTGNCWRKDFFPHYKESDIDFDRVYEIMNTIRQEVRSEMPYVNLQVPRLEADDVIAILCKKYHTDEKILIVSNDKDFQQLQRYNNVRQYSPMQKKFVECSDPQQFLLEHIIKGDVSDGIPNVLSDSDTFVVEGKRQKPCGTKKIQSMINEDHTTAEWSENFSRNQTLIDMTKIPDEFEDFVIREFENYDVPTRKGLLNYFVRSKLSNLMSSIGDF
jgi:5'-3' exonuclease